MSEKKYTRDQIKDAIWQELKDSDYAGENNDRAYEIIGIVMAGIDKLVSVTQPGPVWVKASDRLPKYPDDPGNHYRLNGRKVNGNFYQDSDGMKFFEVRGFTHEPYSIGWKSFQYLEWLDESAPAIANNEIIAALQKFVSRHEAGLLPDRFVYEQAKKALER